MLPHSSIGIPGSAFNAARHEAFLSAARKSEQVKTSAGGSSTIKLATDLFPLRDGEDLLVNAFGKDYADGYRLGLSESRALYNQTTTVGEAYRNAQKNSIDRDCRTLQKHIQKAMVDGMKDYAAKKATEKTARVYGWDVVFDINTPENMRDFFNLEIREMADEMCKNMRKTRKWNSYHSDSVHDTIKEILGRASDSDLKMYAKEKIEMAKRNAENYVRVTEIDIISAAKIATENLKTFTKQWKLEIDRYKRKSSAFSFSLYGENIFVENHETMAEEVSALVDAYHLLEPQFKDSEKLQEHEKWAEDIVAAADIAYMYEDYEPLQFIEGWTANGIKLLLMHMQRQMNKIQALLEDTVDEVEFIDPNSAKSKQKSEVTNSDIDELSNTFKSLKTYRQERDARLERNKQIEQDKKRQLEVAKITSMQAKKANERAEKLRLIKEKQLNLKKKEAEQAREAASNLQALVDEATKLSEEAQKKTAAEAAAIMMGISKSNADADSSDDEADVASFLSDLQIQAEASQKRLEQAVKRVQKATSEEKAAREASKAAVMQVEQAEEEVSEAKQDLVTAENIVQNSTAYYKEEGELLDVVLKELEDKVSEVEDYAQPSVEERDQFLEEMQVLLDNIDTTRTTFQSVSEDQATALKNLSNRVAAVAQEAEKSPLDAVLEKAKTNAEKLWALMKLKDSFFESNMERVTLVNELLKNKVNLIARSKSVNAAFVEEIKKFYDAVGWYHPPDALDKLEEKIKPNTIEDMLSSSTNEKDAVEKPVRIKKRKKKIARKALGLPVVPAVNTAVAEIVPEATLWTEAHWKPHKEHVVRTMFRKAAAFLSKFTPSKVKVAPTPASLQVATAVPVVTTTAVLNTGQKIKQIDIDLNFGAPSVVNENMLRS